MKKIIIVGMLLALINFISFANEKSENESKTVKNTWEKDKIIVTAELNKEEYKIDEPINLTVTIKNESNLNIYVKLNSIYREFLPEIKNIKTGNNLFMTEQYKVTAEMPLPIPTTKIVTIKKDESYTYAIRNMKDFFIFDSTGLYSIMVKGYIYLENEQTPSIQYMLDKLNFEIKDTQKEKEE